MMTPSAKGPKARTVDLVTGKAKVEYFFDPSLVLPPDNDSFDTPAKPSGSLPRTPSIKRKPSELSSEHPSADDGALFSSKHLFMPCTIVKDIDSAASASASSASSAASGDSTPKKDHKSSSDDPVPALVKTSDGQLHKISDRRKLTPLTSPEDYLGIPDVLHLPNVTEASLLHTLRLRYHLDEIYTSAGPILMSVNPYKPMTVPGTPGEDLYSEERMMMYRGSTANFVGATSGSGALAALATAGGKTLPCHLFQVADRAFTSLLSSVVAEEVEPHLEEEDPMVMMEKDHEQKRRNHVVRNQSVIISGESGAGKTEATKKIMQYLARITAKGKDGAGGGGRKASAKEKAEAGSPDDADDALRATTTSLEDRVLSSNPLLESFGNARTLKNDNSSRFGKFIKISFNTDTGTIVGASISNYLLEKTRITTQIEGERNYHIFYQLFSGADEQVLAKFGLEGGIANFRYLGNRATLKSRRDASAFVETMACLDQIGVSEEDKNEVLGIIAAVLHLGNIDFELAKAEGGNSNENARMTDSSAESLRMACSLLGLEESKVSEAMLTKLLTIGGKTIHKPQDVAQASDKRDAFAKLVYSSLFLWMVNKINATLSEDAGPAVPPSPGAEQFSPPPRVHKPSVPTGFIGVLDIYGFENFENNGFEQLLINYANEKLQRHFNRHLFEVEQNLYSSEGVDWTYITFNDNRPCLELIEGGGGNVGILSTLDDCGGMGSASERDVNFLAQINQKFGGKGVSHMNGKKGKKKKTPGSPGKEPERHPNFITPKFGNDRQFVVVHYAGEVRYTVTGFVEKNVETLSNELKDLGSTSSKMFALGVFAASSSPTASSDPTSTPGSARRSTIRGVSVASQFRLSLQMLVMDLECTQPHYVRCIKPNTTKSPNSFDSGEVLRQLRYAGMMETIRIRREGYALREEHESFYRRFHLLLSSTEANQGEGITHLVKVLSQRLQLTDAEWQIGHSKIFLKRDLATKLELLAHLRVRAAGRIVVDFGRKVARTRASNLLTAWGKLQVHLIRKRRQIIASNKISATYRMCLVRRVYKSTLMSVIRIQCLGRRIVACEKVRRERDPYWDKTFHELDLLHSEMVSQMDDAVNAKDFKTAADLEKKLTPLKEALESKRPLTRSVLESRIAEVQTQLDDAVARKAFQECGPLQEKLEELVKKREDLPTLDELKDAVHQAEKNVSDAAARRDFAAAASLQAALDNAKQRLEDACRAENGSSDNDSPTVDAAAEHGFESRAELEAAIAEASANIDEAISKRQFDKATKFQAELERLENLRPSLPSIQEIESELEKLKADMEEAIKTKNFKKAELLHLEVDKLEEKLKEEKSKMPSTTEESPVEKSSPQFVNENGETIIFESRFNLEKEIDRFKSLVQNAASSKNFKEASRYQRFLDQLEELKLLLPTAQEIVEQLDKVKKDMEEAIERKDFEKAEELHTIVEKLEKQVDLEKANIKTPDPITMPKTITATSVKPPVKASIKVLPDAASIVTHPSIATTMKTKKSAKIVDNRPVSKLRPKAPMISQSSDTVLAVAQMLANRRGDAAIITDNSGGLAGIITDTDVTRRVVAKKLPPSSTRVFDVMTANPTCVFSSDSATDALVTMVENHFRHLPVTDDNGAVVGVLDIAKCLNDAITKLEKQKDKSSSAAEDAVKQMASLQGAGGAQAAALQQLLGPLLSQAFGGQSSPTLRTILAGKLSTIASPSTNLQEVGSMMAEARKAALVVDNGKLIGIFGFKDMMSRAIAKELPLELTSVSSVMTPNPESVSPDTTVLEALQIMHDNRFLTLPVCEDNGRVLGVVDVMDCVYASGGADGWRSIFASAMECDDITDTGSVNSTHKSVKSVKSMKSTTRSVKMADTTVLKLRPKAPMICHSSDTVLGVSQMLASKRGDAAIITDSSGGLVGIITDTDVTRRVVAKELPPSSTRVSDVMTANPTCVSSSDSATDALVTMVENRFRHLPVIDDNGSIVGVLDIAKCLNDAITKLEHSKDKSSSAAEDAVRRVASLKGAGGAQATALQHLLGPLLSQAFAGQSSPTLRTILAGKPSTIASPTSNLHEVGLMMAEARKSALVVDGGKLIGIFGFKDMMSRAIAKELPLELTSVSTVMTPNPESVSPDTTVLEALQIMHDNKFLTLPVCEADGRVTGVVDVMDCVYASGGTDGWKSIFASAMECDDITETASVNSHRSAANRSVKSAKSVRKKDERPVSKLRPKKPFLSNESDSVLSVAKMLASKRGDASIVVNNHGALAGIITDTDVTRRVVAKQLPASTTSVSDVMTPNPTCVSVNDSAMDALVTMVENRFRHLPVTDESGSIVGCLDIAKCLNDAITKLERAQEKSAFIADDAIKNLRAAGGNQQAVALQMLLGPLLAQALGGKSSPTLRSVLAGKPSTIVSPHSPLQTVGLIMAEARKAALIVEDNNLVGIFGFKDMMTRVIAKELPLDTTSVSEVMTRNPDAVSPETTVLEALQIMHDNRFLTLPVCEENGLVVGLVDVMDCVYASGGAEGWKSLFDSALDQDDQSSVCSAEEASVQRPVVMVTSHPNNIPLHVEVGNGLSDDHESVGESLTHAPHGTMSAVGSPKVSRKAINIEDLVAFKVVDGAGHTYVIRAEQTIASIIKALEGKVPDLDADVTVFKYFDDEGDEILVTSDDCLEEAVRASVHSGNKSVKLSMATRRSGSKSDRSLLIAGGVGLLAAIGVGIMVLLKPKK